MGFSVRIAPGLRVRASSRGLRASVGPRAARLHVGSGRTGFSTGAGPVGYYTSLGGGSKSSTGRASSQLAMAEKAGQVQQLAEILSGVLKLHEAEFPPAHPPRAASAVRPAEASLYEKHLERAMHGVGRLQFSARKIAKETARQAAHQEADEIYARAQARQVEEQLLLDNW